MEHTRNFTRVQFQKSAIITDTDTTLSFLCLYVTDEFTMGVLYKHQIQFHHQHDALIMSTNQNSNTPLIKLRHHMAPHTVSGKICYVHDGHFSKCPAILLVRLPSVRIQDLITQAHRCDRWLSLVYQR